MNIPNYIQDKFVDGNGNITSEWRNFFNQLITQMQANLSNEGYVLPELSTANISKLTDVTKSKGALIYDSTTNEFKVNINGTWKVVQVI